MYLFYAKKCIAFGAIWRIFVEEKLYGERVCNRKLLRFVEIKMHSFFDAIWRIFWEHMEVENVF